MSRAHTTEGRRTDGFAIAAAVFVIVIVSLLALAGLYVTRSDALANSGLRSSLKAMYAADAGATLLLTEWNRSAFRTLDPGDSLQSGWRDLPDGSRYRTSVLRVDDGLDPYSMIYRLRTVGRPGPGVTAQRVIMTLVKVDRTDGLCCDAAIKLQGRLRIQGTGSGVKLSGLDETPAGWGGTCTGLPADVAGVRMQDENDLMINGRPILEGSPPVLEDPAIVPDDFTQFGDVSYWDLARMADKRLNGGQIFTNIEPVVSDGACVVGRRRPILRSRDYR